MSKKILVTGGTGFLASHIIFQLLQQGFAVKTTIRQNNSQAAILATIKANGIYDASQLSFAVADLNQDAHWEEVMADCDGVISVASPVFFGKVSNEQEVMKPARDGILRILKAASKTGVKRVVMTSNFGAVGFSNLDKNSWSTEENWTDENQAGLSLYEKSKLLAEKAAWQFMKRENPNFDLVVINPVAIFGPSLNGHVSGSFDLLKMLLAGSTKRYPNLPLNVVDVRDVAAIHILAMLTPEAGGQRFIASANGIITMAEIAALIKKERPALAAKVPQKQIPNFLIKLASHFNTTAQEGALFLQMNRHVKNDKAKKQLGWQPLADSKTAVLEAVDSLVAQKHIE